jgi:hypothetical protein
MTLIDHVAHSHSSTEKSGSRPALAGGIDIVMLTGASIRQEG